jgi:hypothetical protein
LCASMDTFRKRHPGAKVHNSVDRHLCNGN